MVRNSKIDQRFLVGMDSTLTPSLNSTGMISPIRVVTEEEQVIERLLLRTVMKPNAIDSQAVFREIHEKYDKTGALLVVKGYTSGNHLVRLSLSCLLRAFVTAVAKTLHGFLIKSEDLRFFLRFEDSHYACKAGLALVLLGKMFSKSVSEEKGIKIACGIDYGKVLLLPGEVYGDPVNVASKLGEDAAKPGELLMSVRVINEVFKGAHRKELLKQGYIFSSKKKITKSNVTIDYASVTFTPKSWIFQALDGQFLPNNEEDWFQKFSSASKEESKILSLLKTGDRGKLEKEIPKQYGKKVILLVTDLSGFTKNTKIYGICQYLGVIAKQRIVFRDILKKYDGQLIKYTGDDVVTFFKDPHMALKAACNARRALILHNRENEVQHHVHIKISIETGTILHFNRDIFGDVFDFCYALADGVCCPNDIVMGQAFYDSLTKKETSKFEKRLVEIRGSERTVYAIPN